MVYNGKKNSKEPTEEQLNYTKLKEIMTPINLQNSKEIMILEAILINKRPSQILWFHMLTWHFAWLKGQHHSMNF